MQEIAKQFEVALTAREAALERAKEAEGERERIDRELEAIKAELQLVKAENSKTADTHNYDESRTRKVLIDLLLHESGWPLNNPQDREFRVVGMPNTSGEGFVDYVLWGDDGKPLGLVEAKRTTKDALEGQEQARRYADCLEKQFGQRPIIFLSNGYEHWIWDDRRYAKRDVQGFFTKDELMLAIKRREILKSLAAEKVNPAIAGRYYQERAIRRVAESFEQGNRRKALLVMATGAGKTRTVIALSDLLMRANWVKRVLFLADRP